MTREIIASIIGLFFTAVLLTPADATAGGPRGGVSGRGGVHGGSGHSQGRHHQFGGRGHGHGHGRMQKFQHHGFQHHGFGRHRLDHRHGRHFKQPHFFTFTPRHFGHFPVLPGARVLVWVPGGWYWTGWSWVWVAGHWR